MNKNPKLQEKSHFWELISPLSLRHWQSKGVVYGALLLLAGCIKPASKTKAASPQSQIQAIRAKSKNAMPVNPVQDPNQLVWAWQPNALHLSITADHDLNRYDEQPHALMVCLYQLSSVNTWSELIKSPSGMDTLLKCEGFDNSVVQSERLFIQPGKQQQLDLDRLENGRYVALVAGYATSKAQRLSSLFKFPVKQATKGFLFWKKQQYWPGDLFINLILTEQSLQSSASS